MQYDPVKRTLGSFFNATPWLRILFYHLLNLLLLRTWHIRSEVARWRKSASRSASILDAGSGFGQYSHYLSSVGKKFSILGVDVKEEQIEDCNRFFTKIGRGDWVKFEVADLTQFKKTNQFDMILSVDVMEHIEDDNAVFKNFYASLKPGALLLISTPSDQGGSDSDHHHHEGEAEGFIDEHVRDGYSVSDITLKLKKVGFSKIVCRYSYGKSGSIAWRLSMKYPIILLNISKLFLILLPFYYMLIFPVALVLNAVDTVKHHKKGTGLIVRAYK